MERAVAKLRSWSQFLAHQYIWVNLFICLVLYRLLNWAVQLSECLKSGSSCRAGVFDGKHGSDDDDDDDDQGEGEQVGHHESIPFTGDLP